MEGSSMSTSVYTQCPNIVPMDEIDTRPQHNKPTTYECEDGTEYVFYDHTDPDGRVTRVQFCKRMGRKRDVFECLNEDEWSCCHVMRERQA